MLETLTDSKNLMKEGKVKNRRDVWDILKNNVYLDAVIYADVGLKAAVAASGSDRLMFGESATYYAIQPHG